MLFWIILGIVVGVIGLGWIYHKYKGETTAVLDQGAEVVNNEINAVKTKIANTANTSK